MPVSKMGFPPPRLLLKIFRQAGWRAISDFFLNFPKLVAFHLKADRHFARHRRFENAGKPDQGNR